MPGRAGYSIIIKIDSIALAFCEAGAFPPAAAFRRWSPVPRRDGQAALSLPERAGNKRREKRGGSGSSGILRGGLLGVPGLPAGEVSRLQKDCLARGGSLPAGILLRKTGDRLLRPVRGFSLRHDGGLLPGVRGTPAGLPADAGPPGRKRRAAFPRRVRGRITGVRTRKGRLRRELFPKKEDGR